MNVRRRLAELIDLYHSFVEPYERITPRNPQDLGLKTKFLSAGCDMSGNDEIFAEWFKRTFRTDFKDIPRVMYSDLLSWIEHMRRSDVVVSSKTLKWWWETGRKRFPDFNQRYMGIIAGATHFRTRFPNRMTEHEAMHMILQWLPSYAPEPATQTTPKPFIHLPPMVLRLPEVQVVALLPAITDTPLVYGCDQFIQVPVEVDAAPAFAGQDNRTQAVTVRVIEVEPELVYTCQEPARPAPFDQRSTKKQWNYIAVLAKKEFGDMWREELTELLQEMFPTVLHLYTSAADYADYIPEQRFWIWMQDCKLWLNSNQASMVINRLKARQTSLTGKSDQPRRLAS